MRKILFALCTLSTIPAFALFSTFDTADVLKRGEYSLGLETQAIFNRFNGANIVGHFDMGVNDSGNLRFVAGSGATTFQAGGFYKYAPIPDYESQPGIGLTGGLVYSNYKNESYLHFRFHPLISKKFAIDGFGDLTPYTSLPFGISTGGGKTTYPLQWAIGAKWLPSAFENLFFLLEGGIDINSAFNYISLGLTVPFESFESLKLK